MLDDTTAPTGLFADDTQVTRCVWYRATPHYQHYHDHEWGYPVDSDTRLFEKICLEGFQAGLSWLTILNKRESFRAAFAGFDMDKVAAFDDADVKRLVLDAGIVRKRGWSFVGPTTMYAFMQAMGLVNDHLEGCHARERALQARADFVAPKPA